MKTKIELIITVLSLLLVLFFPPIGVLISFLIVITYLTWGKNRALKFRSIGFKTKQNWPRLILICLIIGIVIEISFQILFNPILENITDSKIDLSAYDHLRGNILNYLIMILVGWIVGGFIEEILFRGFLITRISGFFKHNTLGDIIGLLTTSAAFGYSHMYQGWSGVLSTGLISLIFGIIYLNSGKNLWYPILTHGFVNMAALTIIYLDIDTYLGGILF
jgi:uncharacterized protein